jgi:molecular chaperone GrpE
MPCDQFLFLQVFEKHGLERFNPVGEAFDPNQHQAVYEVDDATQAPGTVAVVLKVIHLFP